MSRVSNSISPTTGRARERLIRRLTAQGITDTGVLKAIKTVPRHLFLDEALSHQAYDDNALPIGHGQTLSQPYTVAKMISLLLATGPCQRVLEVGTGTGYQTALLAQLTSEVYSLERIYALYLKARQNIWSLKLNNARLLHSDGYLGWQSQSPFDAIIVSAASKTLPETLIGQLTEGGRMIVPVGSATGQILTLVTRKGETFTQKKLESVRFVPLLSGVVQ